MKSAIEELSDNLRQLLEDAESLLKARDEVTNRAHKLDGEVHAHPWRALLATAVLGFIAGLSVRRR